MKPDNLVFVYGTLKRGQYNNRLLQRPSKAEFVSTGFTAEKWLMFDGGFPRVARQSRNDPQAANLGHVVGEVWKVDEETLMDLDRLEGHPRMYCREKVTITVGPAGHKGNLSAWMYVIVDYPLYNEPVVPEVGMLEWRDTIDEVFPAQRLGKVKRGAR